MRELQDLTPAYLSKSHVYDDEFSDELLEMR
jgi:hypothetical protein